MMNKYFRLVYLLLTVVSLSQLSFAKAGPSGWQLYGYIIDGSTCTAVPGATISAPFTGATNITNSNGYYTIYLGEGPWNVTISDTGYQSATYITPALKTGSLEINYTILKPGATAVKCAQTSGYGGGATSSVTTTVSSGGSPTTTVNSTGGGGSTGTGGSYGNGTGGISSTTVIEVVIALVVIVGLAYFLMGKKKR